MEDLKGWNGLLIATSDVFGWIYFGAWSLSFYPQPLLNYKRRSTSGFTVDFPLLNILGFVCYTSYTTGLLFVEPIRKQYAARYPNAPIPTVRVNDFAFALHALVICIITYSQLWSGLWGFSDVPGKRAASATYGIFWGSVISILVVTCLVFGSSQTSSSGREWRAIDIIYAASWVKLIVTCAKYAPQAWHNYRAKSTTGWSILQVLLDLTGGILSITQMIIDSARQADWSGVTGNPVKFWLGNVSIFFDIIFILQHYVLYNKRYQQGKASNRNLGEREPLLAEGSS